MSKSYAPGRITPHGEDGEAVIAVDGNILNNAVVVILGALKSGFTFEEMVMAVGAASVGQHLDPSEFLNCVHAGRCAGEDGLVQWEEVHRIVKKINVQKLERPNVTLTEHAVNEALKKHTK